MESDKNRYVVAYLERFAFAGEDCSKDDRRCALAYENYCLIDAPSPAAAYDKMMTLAREAEATECVDTATRRKGHWIAEGVTMLLPLQEELQDGAELFFTEHRNRSVNTLRQMVFSKEELISSLS